MAKLPSERDTPDMGGTISEAFGDTEEGQIHWQALPVFEHGHWWINCGPCGAQWGVADAEGGDSIEGFVFEEVSQGDGYCTDHLEDDDLAERIDSGEARAS